MDVTQEVLKQVDGLKFKPSAAYMNINGKVIDMLDNKNKKAVKEYLQIKPMKTIREKMVLIKDMINTLKRNGLNPPYCLICQCGIDTSNFHGITKIQIDPEISEDEIFLYPCNSEITRSNTGIYEITYIPEK